MTILQAIHNQQTKVLVSLPLAVALWHGGFFAGAHYLFAALALVALVVCRPRPLPRDPLWVALVVIAVANVLAALDAGRRDTLPATLAACAMPVLYPIAVRLGADADLWLLKAVTALAAASAVAGIVAYATHRGPDAESIDGIWRAGGPFEYPPALALLCVCGIAATMALAASAELGWPSAAALMLLFAGSLVLTFDRASEVWAVVVVAVFTLRLRVLRRLLPALVTGLVVGAVVVAVSPPSATALADHLQHGLISSRTGVWSDAWRGVRTRPGLGYGPGGFVRIYRHVDDPTETGLAHNLPLEQAVEAGVVAGVAAAALLLVMFTRSARCLMTRDPVLLGWGAIAGVTALTSLYDFTWSFPPLALLGLIAAARCRQRPSQ